MSRSETRSMHATGEHASKRPASQPDISDMLFMTDLGFAASDDISLAGSTPEDLLDAYCVNNALIITAILLQF